MDPKFGSGNGMGSMDPRQIDEWYENYAVGCPPFAEDVRQELLDLKTDTRVLRDAICLSAALTLNARDLVHDITQSIMDYKEDLAAMRDDIITLTHQAIGDFTLGDYTLIKEGDGFMSPEIRQTVAIIMNIKLDTDHIDVQRMRELVSIIRRVHILI